MLGMIIGMAKIVRALKCLDAPCRCQQCHSKRPSDLAYFCCKGRHEGNIKDDRTIPAVSIAMLAVD